MRKDLTDLTIIVDRSGSMYSCHVEATNGINRLIEEQKNSEGYCTFSLFQFDDDYECVYDAQEINDVKEFKLEPRGMTALLDAVGRSINSIGNRLSNIDETDRPSLVVVVIVTDGEENSSHEFTKAQIKEMIERQQDEYQWKFIFLGANQDAFNEAAGIGISAQSAATYDTKMSDKAYGAVSSSVLRMRDSCISGGVPVCNFTSDERDNMV